MVAHAVQASRLLPVALADAGISMHDLVASCAAGKVDNRIVLDINDEEDKEGQADMPVAYMPRLEQVTLLQPDGRLAPEQFEECLEKAIDGCKMVYEIQKQALMQRHFGNETELREESIP